MKSASKKSSAKPAKDTSSFFQKKNDTGFFNEQANHTSFFGNANGVQAKLTVGQPNDKYEKEADHTADKVLQQLNTPPGNTENHTVQNKPAVPGISPLVQEKCKDCEEKDKQEKDEKSLQRKPFANSADEDRAVQRKCDDCEEEEANLQKKESNAGETSVTPSIESKLSSSKGGGTPLPAGVNQSMSSAFGSDFSNVRVHNDSESAQMSKQLNAQAFTHGSDIYFNSGKYDTSSKQGQHLLAHELTHTVQQGQSSGHPIQSSTVPSVQKDGSAPAALDAKTLSDAKRKDDSYIIMNGSTIEVHFRKFPLKQYSTPFLTKEGDFARTPFKKPKPPRKTKQGYVWKRDALDAVKACIDDIISKKQVQGPDFKLSVKNSSDKVPITGTAEQLAKEVVVPYWSNGGVAVKHQIEHKIDWQIAGGNQDVDVISNLILLDSAENIRIGQFILNSMRTAYGELIKYYRDDKKITGLINKFDEASESYEIWCDDFVSDPDAVKGSLISKSNIEKIDSPQNPISSRLIDISTREIPAGHFILKTSMKGGGNIVPYDFSNDYIVIVGKDVIEDGKKTRVLESITLKDIVKDEKGNIDPKNPDKKLTFTKEAKDIYKVNTEGYAAVLKSLFRINGLSPIEWSELEFNPETGWNATGKVTSDLSLLKDVDIDIILENSVFTVQASITSDKLKNKFPKPFQIDYCTLGLAISTKDPITVFGELGFSIEKIGKGTIGAWAGLHGFGLQGSFLFENSKLFKKAEIGFNYSKTEKEDDWVVKGSLEVEENKIKGVKSGGIEISYEKKTIKGKGNAVLTIPGAPKVELEAQFAEKSFSITGKAIIEKTKGIKSGDITVTISKEEGKDYRLSGKGTVVPDIPSVPGLDTSFTVSYDDGLFKVEGHAKYAKGKLEGDITVGVTNGVIDEEGKVQKAEEGAKDLKFYGNGSLSITLVKSMKWTLNVFIDPKGEILLSAEIKIHSSPFDPVKKSIDLFHIDKNIPLVGIPFANVFLKVGAGASIFLEWEPLVIDFETSLKKTPLEEIKKGKLGGTSTLKVHSIAKAGIQLDVKVGAGVAVTVLALSVNVTGSVGVGIKGDAGAEINADWDSEKGLKFKDATFKVEIAPQAILALKGTIEAELDLIVSSVKIYTYNLGEAKREIDIKGLSFNAELPVSFDESGAVKKADVEKLVPKLDAATGEKMLKQGITGEGSSTPEPVSQEDTAKQSIKNQINADLKAKLASKQSSDIVTYASSLQRKYGNVADQKLRTFVLATVEGEMRSVTAEEFENLKNDLRLSKDPLATKLQRIAEFERRFTPFFNKEDTTILRNELKQQAADQQPPVQKKPIFESNNDEDEKVQKKTEAGSVNQAQGEELSDSIENTEEMIQRVPQAGEVLPSTDKQQRYYKYRNEVVNILGNASFEPSRGLGNYISSMWENHQEPAVNVKVGNLGEGYIFLKPGTSFIKKDPICVPVTFGVSLCVDRTPDAASYTATRQVIPIIHPAFGNRDDGTVVYVVEIINGFIKGNLGWIPGKKAISIDPLLDVALVQTGEGAFLPLIYGKEYDGTNYVSAFFKEGGTGSNLFFLTSGILQLPNQQKIEGSFSILNESYKFEANLIGKPEGLDTYKAPVTRTPDTLLTAETTTLVLDANWTSGKANEEDGTFTASSQLRLSYANGILEIFGSAKYASARFNGEVNITVTTKSQSEKLFAEHAAEIGKEKKGVGLSGGSDKENPEEPLALTAWGDLSFRIIDTENKAAAAGAGAGAKKSPLENLEGKASFVVSSDGFIILAGRVKLPTEWKLTPKLDYTSTDPENKDKHLFQHEQSIVEAWVPETIGSIEVIVGIVVDADAHLDPLKLYEIEVSGVYSNHPKYRSEINLTPKFFISGNAGAKVSVSAEGVYKFLGLIKTASIKGTVTGEARIGAYIDAAPTISRIWAGDDKAATYGLSGIIQTGGELTFTLTGSLHLEAFGAKLLDSEDYQIGKWTLKRFAVELKMDEYLLGSGGKPNIDYGKMGMNGSQRHSLGQSITEEIEGKKTGPDTRTGGFEQEEGGKMKEKGTFSATPPPPRPDHGKDAVDNRIEENFLMGNRLHDLVIIIGGTRESPTAILKMASGNEEPLVDKIEDEKIIVELKKAVTADSVEQKRIDTRLRDLQAIEREAKNVEKNAKETAQQEPVKDPKVAGFDQIDDRIADYAQKYDKEDLGTIIPSPDPKGSPPTTTPTSTPTPATPTTPGTSTAGGTTTDLKKLKVGDLLSVPYKNGRGRADVLEIKDDFVTILIKTKSRSSDIKNMIPRSRFKDMLDNGDIFIWSELRRFLMNNRPKYVTGLVEQVWNNAIESDGKVRDPNPPHEILTWHRSQSRYAQWHMGHKPEHKYSDLVDQLVNEEIDWDQFIEEYNRPGNYHPELPSKNMGHGFEEAEQP